jgi:hypothetical protein
MRSLFRTFATLSLVALALSGCGGGKSSSTASATAAPTTEAQREAAALPSKVVAVVPAGLHCGATKPVWVNLKSKAYHEYGDPYYGRTKNGEYLCASDAESKGFHPAGAVHHHKRGSMSGSAGAPETAPT